MTFLRHTDGELISDQSLKAELVRLIRIFQPDVLLTWDPWRHHQLHSDHTAAGQAALDAAIVAGSARYFPEQLRDGLQPHRIEEIYFFGTDSPDVWVDISDIFLRKIQAISQHLSQVGNTITEIEKKWVIGTGIWVRVEVSPTLKRLRYCGPTVRYAADYIQTERRKSYSWCWLHS